VSAAQVRELAPGDLEAALELNQHWVPHVGSIDAAGLGALVEQASLSLVAETTNGELGGFAVVLREGADYGSPNYRWFAGRHGAFTYLDRIAIAPESQGSGLGRMLYGVVADWGRSVGSPVLCAEVNLVPPNPESLAFHRRLGFADAGTQWTYDNTVQVQMLEMEL